MNNYDDNLRDRPLDPEEKNFFNQLDAIMARNIPKPMNQADFDAKFDAELDKGLEEMNQLMQKQSKAMIRFMLPYWIGAGVAVLAGIAGLIWFTVWAISVLIK